MLSDGSGPWDPAAWQDWMRALNSDQPVTMLGAFRAMINFLNAYYARTSSTDIKILLNSMQEKENEKVISIVWDNWTECINEVIKRNRKAI